MNPKVSIEYAHIYSNQAIDAEHELSLKVLGDLKHRLETKGQDYSLLVLVDDYSFPDPTFDYDGFSDWLGQHGLKPDLLFRESQLIPLCDEVIGLIENQRLRNQTTQYIQGKKYPCSLFIASWYLLRLGKLEDPRFPKMLQAEKLINILPRSFEPFERQALEIIGATKFAEVLGNIEYEYIEGRAIQ